MKKNTEVEKELNNMGELVFSFDEEKIESVDLYNMGK